MDKYPGASKKISIHALREEGDLAGLVVVLCHLVFLSTPSARRATSFLVKLVFQPDYFYPRPPRGGRPLKSSKRVENCLISIHALREEGDLQLASNGIMVNSISIHALREEGDGVYTVVTVS